MASEEKTAEVNTSVKCKNCGAAMKFAPGTNSMKCEFCGAVNDIDSTETETKVEETDFEKFLDETNLSADQKQEVITVKCSACGASSTLKPNVTSDNCPFCDNPLVVQGGTTSSIIKPKYLLPFSVDKKAAFDDFSKWVSGLWFAPNNLVQYAKNIDKLNGMYIPYWTYNSDTSSDYMGMRGDNYYVEEEYTTTEDGEEVTRTRTVTKIMWTPASGTVEKNFSNVLVLASKSLPEKYTYALEPWDITHLTNYSDSFLAGFRTEIYQVDVKNGFGTAKNHMEPQIRSLVNQNIGGDHQQIERLDTDYKAITFKHVLLPIWLSAYRYNDKVYRFMINGRTGAVQGERPYSWTKIAVAVIAGIIALGIIISLFANSQH